MRKLTKDDWAGHHPATNALWMHYLADNLLTDKNIPGEWVQDLVGDCCMVACCR